MVKTTEVNLGARSYPILTGPGLLEQAGAWVGKLNPTRIVIVTNETVQPLYLERLAASCRGIAPVSSVILPDGERFKNFSSVQKVLDGLAAAGADRRSVICALGGGVVGDIAGFAAAIWMRGIRFVQFPTTLLAQVDSSVGGKTGVNLPAGKNLIGCFHQPSLVVADTQTLETLPAREVSAGLGEIIKHGLLGDAAYFDMVFRNMAAIRRLDHEVLAEVIAGSCELKAGIVSRDEKESGIRATLNLGHTFGHAIEKLAGFGTWLHGEAVGCGLVLAADLSRRLGYLTPEELGRVTEAVRSAGLPVRIEGLPLEAAIACMKGDKKSAGGHIRFVVLHGIGRTTVEEAPMELLRQTLLWGGYRP
ncbi:3-dehydroquinate synthase [Mesosutterella sp. AGMB02718]|uniref:3-dehydroquinate synthase n=1 Tax=Mesosutterella faecium TaxID=2925194 RepID=A0ABT7IL60_9BURK|nr:3-dehydroquinate synthase [Mesosutterella sp. AGMB02718]MDL2058725.1 3-dehydroquinate synthase [Mesosutterella sp. AGMB02718]